MKKPSAVWAGFVSFFGLVFILHAQETATPVQGSATTAQNVNSMSDLEVMLQAVESVPPAPATTVSSGGTFYSAQHAPGSRLAWPPLPGNINNLPVWNLGDGVYLLDDRNVDYSPPLMPSRMSGGRMMAMDGLAPPGGGGDGTGGFYSGNGVHTVTSSQPVGVEVYGWGFCDAYGYFGGIVK